MCLPGLQTSLMPSSPDRLQNHLNIDRPLLHSLNGQQVATIKNRLNALDTWADWANGNTPRPAALTNTAHHLHRAGGPLALLAQPLTEWMQQHNLAPQPPARTVEPVTQREVQPTRPGLEIDF